MKVKREAGCAVNPGPASTQCLHCAYAADSQWAGSSWQVHLSCEQKLPCVHIINFLHGLFLLCCSIDCFSFKVQLHESNESFCWRPELLKQNCSKNRLILVFIFYISLLKVTVFDRRLVLETLSRTQCDTIRPFQNQNAPEHKVPLYLHH